MLPIKIRKKRVFNLNKRGEGMPRGESKLDLLDEDGGKCKFGDGG